MLLLNHRLQDAIDFRIKEEKEIKDQKRELENMKENLNEIKEKLEHVFSILVTKHSKEVSANEFDA